MAVTADGAVLSAERELVITRIFDAPRRLLFKMWTEPEHLERWWGPAGFTMIFSRMDVRRGGAWTRSMQAPDGSVIRKHGVYREIVPPRASRLHLCHGRSRRQSRARDSRDCVLRRSRRQD